MGRSNQYNVSMRQNKELSVALVILCDMRDEWVSEHRDVTVLSMVIGELNRRIIELREELAVLEHEVLCGYDDWYVNDSESDGIIDVDTDVSTNDSTIMDDINDSYS